jgi:alkanesulfonate monooxygenase SsuD/methylene tetrahydromethanopterin reductase-like flavin-dependent oxidoreductase (luciferase family)
MRRYVAEVRQAFDETGLEKISDIPVLVAATGPQMVQLAAEIADGWMPSFFLPGALAAFEPTLAAGFARSGRTDTASFETWAHVDMVVDDDVRAAMRPFKEYTAMWSAMQRPMHEARGYTEMADRLAELVPAGRMEEAIEAVPDEYIDEGWLVGPLERIRTRVVPWLESELTGLIFRYGAQVGADRSGAPENLDAFRIVAEVAGRAPRRP